MNFRVFISDLDDYFTNRFGVLFFLTNFAVCRQCCCYDGLGVLGRGTPPSVRLLRGQLAGRGIFNLAQRV